MRAITAFLIVGGVAHGMTATAGNLEYHITSEAGAYQIKLAPAPGVVRLGDLHSWRLVVLDADGQSVENAMLSVDGGMPAHGHGLPTAPQVVEEGAAGLYRIEGLRFNMPGRWVLQVTIDGVAGSDIAILDFQL